MAAYVGGRRHTTDFDYNRRFPDSTTNHRLHYDDLDLNDNRRYNSRDQRWHQRRSYSEHELEGDFIDARETKLCKMSLYSILYVETNAINVFAETFKHSIIIILITGFYVV